MRVRRHVGLVCGGLLAALVVCAAPAAATSVAVALPEPPAETPADGAASAVAVLAGGCFWGVQAVFQHVKGVTRAVSGYAGGTAETATYEAVSAGNTGHAEAVEITFDPRAVSYGKLLQIFFSVAHDPTQLDRQGPDEGPQYRSAIFARDAAQARIARAYVAGIDRAGAFPRPIVTRIDPAAAFYPAEDYHQDYATRHPNQPYVFFNDLPKIASLERMFPDLYRDRPVLVMSGRAGR